jgi:hypothetical protein
MASTDYTHGTARDEQVTALKGVEVAIEEAMKRARFCLPAIIKSFDAAAMTVEAQPTIAQIYRDGSIVPVPMLIDCPVIFPQGGGFALTFPIKAGDECLLFFGDRCKDAWHQTGKIEAPDHYRIHDLSDGFCFVGVNSKPKLIPNVNTENVQLRTKDGGAYFEIQPNKTLHAKNAGVEYTATNAGALTITTAADVTLNCHGNATANIDKTATVNVGQSATVTTVGDASIVAGGTATIQASANVNLTAAGEVNINAVSGIAGSTSNGSASFSLGGDNFLANGKYLVLTNLESEFNFWSNATAGGVGTKKAWMQTTDFDHSIRITAPDGLWVNGVKIA